MNRRDLFSKKQYLPEQFIPGILFGIMIFVLFSGGAIVKGQIQNAVSAPSASVLSMMTSVPTITQTLTIGSTDKNKNGEVTLWQDFLIRENKGPAAAALGALFQRSNAYHGIFGAMTGRATVEWQKANGIPNFAPAVGVRTRAFLRLIRPTIGGVNNSGLIRITAPTATQTVRIGDTLRIEWDLFPAPNVRYGLSNAVAVLSFGNSSHGGVIGSAKFSDLAYNWKVDTVIINGDIVSSIVAGDYNLSISLYDEMPCLSMCATPSGNLIAQAKSDIVIRIVPAEYSANASTEISFSSKSGYPPGFANIPIKLEQQIYCITTPCESPSHSYRTGSYGQISIPNNILREYRTVVADGYERYQISDADLQCFFSNCNARIALVPLQSPVPHIDSALPNPVILGQNLLLRGTFSKKTLEIRFALQNAPNNQPKNASAYATSIDGTTLLVTVPRNGSFYGGCDLPVPGGSCESSFGLQSSGSLPQGQYAVNIIDGIMVSNSITVTLVP